MRDWEAIVTALAGVTVFAILLLGAIVEKGSVI